MKWAYMHFPIHILFPLNYRIPSENSTNASKGGRKSSSLRTAQNPLHTSRGFEFRCEKPSRDDLASGKGSKNNKKNEMPLLVFSEGMRYTTRKRPYHPRYRDAWLPTRQSPRQPVSTSHSSRHGRSCSHSPPRASCRPRRWASTPAKSIACGSTRWPRGCARRAWSRAG
jgi:hypothetical protein